MLVRANEDDVYERRASTSHSSTYDNDAGVMMIMMVMMMMEVMMMMVMTMIIQYTAVQYSTALAN